MTRSPWLVLFTAVLLGLAHANTAYAQVPLAAAPAKCIGGEKDSRGRSSVDLGEVSWEDETKYDDARSHAAKAWSTNGLTKIEFPKDDATRVADLEWSDVNETNGQWKDVGAAWTPFPAPMSSA
ncbi:hypothetical protein AB0A69_32680 [Streptomyces sp. NPDC045431]|uniref:hypothetical protein n=1 Tax=Streptomyces sp. NPDC045431 TaxID=3155613 RepID=UPI0033FC3921